MPFILKQRSLLQRGEPPNLRQKSLSAPRYHVHRRMHLNRALLTPDTTEVARMIADRALRHSIETSFIIRSTTSNASYLYMTFCALSVALVSLIVNLFGNLQLIGSIMGDSTQTKDDRELLYGVNVSGSRFFHDPTVLRAVEFAAEAHKGQTRKTGEPYVSHCIETALIVENNIPPSVEQERYTSTIVAAVLHDVIDDTNTGTDLSLDLARPPVFPPSSSNTDLASIRAEFGDQVAVQVAKISQLSQMNQLLRRGKRQGFTDYTPDQFRQLRKMIIDLSFEEPLVILIKLADRLHNMRSVHVLKPEKQLSVSGETLEVWCTMAECLGWDAMKSEMEDLCFAVMQPQDYCKLRGDLDRLWNLPTLRLVDDLSFSGEPFSLTQAKGSTEPRQPGREMRPLKAAAVARAKQRELVAALAGGGVEVSRLRREEQEAVLLSSPPSSPSSPSSSSPQPQLDSSADLGIKIITQSFSISSLSSLDCQGASGAEIPCSILPSEEGTSISIDDCSSFLFPPIPLPSTTATSSTSTSSSHLQPPDYNLLIQQQQKRLEALLSTVVPFDSVNFKSTKALSLSAQRGLEVLDECARLLYSEVGLRSTGPGLSVKIEGRLKSLQSVYRKMARKKCSVSEVYDARALRVIVDDEGGARMQDAVETCYSLVSTVHSIWKPIPLEFDDYIANPKPSGYQALHTAVKGPGGIPMELQIKTSSMHDLAEYGAAAHWVYKEYVSPGLTVPSPKPIALVEASKPSRPFTNSSSRGVQVKEPLSQQVKEPLSQQLKGVKGYVGQPILRIARDKLRYGVVVEREEDGSRLMVAIKMGGTFVGLPTRVPSYGFYWSLAQYVTSRGWLESASIRGDMNVRLEEYVKAKDGRFHRWDHMGYLTPHETITILEGYDEEAEEAAFKSAAFSSPPSGLGGLGEGDVSSLSALAGSLTSGTLESIDDEEVAQPGPSSRSLGLVEEAQRKRSARQMQEAFLRTQQLRTMIEWGESAISLPPSSPSPSPVSVSDEVSILVYPEMKIEYFRRGTTVGEVVRDRGLLSLGYDRETLVAPGDLLVNVNNRLVTEDTVLQDGDLVILARDKMKI